MLTLSLLLCAVTALVTADPKRKVSSASDDIQLPAPSCPVGWSQFNSRCFLYIPRELSWAWAEKNCQTLKGNLASIHSLEEYQHIQGIIQAHTQAAPLTWVGGSDCQEDNVWLWSDGSDFVFTFWCTGEPNNQNGNQACIHMNLGENKCWDDTHCVRNHPSVCSMNR